MPTPIPDWDLARRLLRFVGLRQIAGKNTTIRETSRTLGIGRERIESLVKEKQIVISIQQANEKEPSNYDLIAIRFAPPNLAIDAGVSNIDLERSYQEFLAGEQTERIVRAKKLTKRQHEKLKIAGFWGQRKEE